MNNIFLNILCVVIAYFIGGFDFAYFLIKFKKGTDIRNEGSGNPGTANVLRNYGKKMAIAVFAGDFLKGLLVVLAAKWMGFTGWWLMGIAFAVVVGHNWPILLHFKGGKGVATTIGVLTGINFQVGIYPLVLGLSVAFISKMIALGSIIGVGSFPIFDFIYCGTSDYYVLTLGIILAVMCIVQHRSNIARMIRGEENKVTKKHD